MAPPSASTATIDSDIWVSSVYGQGPGGTMRCASQLSDSAGSWKKHCPKASPIDRPSSASRARSIGVASTLMVPP